DRGMYMSAAAGDLDGDGDLDLVVAGQGIAPDEFTSGFWGDFYSTGGAPNALFLRGEDGTYALRMDLAPAFAEIETTLVMAVSDLNGDGTQDIYVGNDFGNRLRNRVLVRDADGVFVDRGDEFGMTYDAAGFGI